MAIPNSGSVYVVESFTENEAYILRQYFTNIDGPVFCPINLPQILIGALFARYSRSPKSTRRLFLDEFVARKEIAISCMAKFISQTEAEKAWEDNPSSCFYYIAKTLARESQDPIFSTDHAENLYRRIFDEYGDDSVSQIGGVHIVFEQVSNIVINEIERGRLAAYLEQSTRYIDYSLAMADGRFRYYLPSSILDGRHGKHYCQAMDQLFGIYQQMLEHAKEYFQTQNPRSEFDGDNRAYQASIKAQALDAVRPILPAGIVSNVGFYGSAQAAANMLRRLMSSGLPEARAIGLLALTELRHPDASPAFFNQVDDPKKGLEWIKYKRDTRASVKELVGAYEKQNTKATGTSRAELSDNEVALGWSDPDNLLKVASAIIFEQSSTNQTFFESRELANSIGPQAQERLVTAYCGDRGSFDSATGNRRWKPGRAFEHATYSFDMLIDFGIMRDWKRHRLLTMEWGEVGPSLGWTMSPVIEDMGQTVLYKQAMDLSRMLYMLLSPDYPLSAQYVTCLAYRMRVIMNINARALMFMLELRTGRDGHPAYRKVGQQMHKLVCAVDPVIGNAMSYVDHNAYGLSRAASEQRLSIKRSKDK